jgi:PAS domain S-box-containing protein
VSISSSWSKVKAKRKLEEREERYRTLVESAPVGILSVDRHGCIQELNKKMLEILGSPSQEATKAINVLTFPLLVSSGIAANFQRCFRTGESRVLESPYTSRWGRKAFLRYHLSPLKREQDRIITVQAIVEDISEQKRLEQGILDSQEREALGILGGGIAHEFNNLLQVIQGYAEILAYDSRLPLKRSQAVLEIQHASQRAAELTRRLLNEMNREPLPSPSSEKNKTILFADNELIQRKLAVEFLGNFGYAVLSVGDCEEAMAVFREHGARIDLVILDLIMPELGGEWCIREMLQLKPEQKILVASDYSLCATVSELLRLGSCTFITKPYRLLELLATVREALEIAAQG